LLKARELAQQRLHLAQRVHDPALLLEADPQLGSLALFLGELASARAHFAQAVALYHAQQHRSHALVYGVDPGVVSWSHGSHVLWLLGHPIQALHSIQQVLTLAHELAHPFSLGFALHSAARLHQFRRESHAAHERAEALLALSTAHGFQDRVAEGTILRGWALAEQGERAEGMMQMRQGLAALQAAERALRVPYWLALLGEAYGTVGQAEEGLRVLAEAMIVMEHTGERRWEAELHRLTGQVLLAHSADHQAEAETCFRQALDVARRQEAKAWELRAAMSLSRLWQRQGKRQEAHALLVPIYGWFTEGFDTADLQEAKALLTELGP
jgi:predicted ATPase